MGFGRETREIEEFTVVNPGSENPIREPTGNIEIVTKPKTIAFLGYGQVGVDEETKPEFRKILSDSAGLVPQDLIYGGDEAYNHITLSRWNEGVLQLAENRPYTFRTNPGSASKTDIGRAMLAQDSALSLYIVHARRNNNIEDLPPGIRYPYNTVLFHSIRKKGSRPNLVQCLFYSIPRFSKRFNLRGLYDYDVSDVVNFVGDGINMRIGN